MIVTRSFFVAGTIYYLGRHYAIDIVRIWVGTYLADIIAPGDGQAMAVPWFDQYRGYYVIWAGPNGWRMHVAHLASFNIPVGVWVPVKQGQVMGFADNTGASAGHHAHVDWINPAKLGSEAVYKPPMGGYAHDVSKWINVDIGWAKPPAPQQEVDVRVIRSPDGLCCTLNGVGRRWIPTVEQLSAYVKVYGPAVEITQAEMNSISWDLGTSDIWHILFDHGVAEPGDQRRLMLMSWLLSRNHQMLFDPIDNDAPADNRRLVAIGNRVKP